MTLHLRIDLRTDAAPGAGTGGPDVDRDVPHDTFGLPYLPGRRLKGLLREACLEVFEALSLAGLSAWSDRHVCGVNELFGTPDREGLFSIGDARFAGEGDVIAVDDYLLLTEWLTWDASRGDSLLTPESVLRRFTTVRTQTAINPETGAAQHGALRSTRLVRHGLRFHGALSLRAPSLDIEVKARRTLALAASALRRLGASRNRGVGVVRCRLWDDADLTASAVADLETHLAGASDRRHRR